MQLHFSKKLEKIIPPHLFAIRLPHEMPPEGKWMATLFNLDRKKCLLVTHLPTRYSVLVPEYKTKDALRLTDLVLEAFAAQLQHTGTDLKKDRLLEGLSSVKFFRTDNDRKVIGTQNYLLGILQEWKTGQPRFSAWDFSERAAILNKIPYQQLNCSTPQLEMEQFLKEVLQLC
ncbi:DUF6933 domain-containing protein [Persicobacter psychrovividus]|uniref:DUF6933 domain-containing protein n=1 Tax=Persicobacter psychrovividus TaxID=387638 RepID=A0ABM7VIP4_9BACT|nr:hypothetical protein PEPS_31280 [Persicobacter psychrovividus]